MFLRLVLVNPLFFFARHQLDTWTPALQKTRDMAWFCGCWEFWVSSSEALPGGGGGSHVAHLNFKTPCVGVYKCLSLIVGFAVTVAIWPREVVSCRDFILHAVATFWAMLLVEIYPSRASVADPGRGSGGSRRTPIRPDACLRLKFLHRQDRISLFNWLFFFNEMCVAFCH